MQRKETPPLGFSVQYLLIKKIHPGGILMKLMSSIQSRARNVEYDFTEAKSTGCGGVSFATHLAKESGLCSLLEMGLNGTLKIHRRNATEAQSLRSQVYLLSMGSVL